ncbi:MAG: C10 family peptidase [Bacteroidales bacterium]|nr:C10 family peptidase [Bacteroidales bacterium]
MKHFTELTKIAAIALLATPVTTFARQLTVDEALAAVGRTFMPAKVKGNGNMQLRYTARANGINTVYVVSSGEGYLVLSADDVATPLLGYADNGSFDINDMPPAMRQWLDDYSAQIAAAVATGGVVTGAAPLASYSNIRPIVTTRWNQDSPYNDKCPRVDGRATYTGCVATALAQVMNVHKWPEKASGTNTYEWQYYNSSGQLQKTNITLDFSTIPLSWSSMIDNYSNGAGTTAQRTAVANLMYAAGVASNMQYGTGESGASTTTSARGLVDYFDYDKGLLLYERNLYPLTTWTDMLYTELAAGRPVLYSGQNANGASGHAFVIDGYSAGDGLFHVNWGWGGMSDGYYLITTLEPGQQGIGGSTAGYSNDQSAVMGIQPPVPGSEYKTVFGVNDKFSTSKETYTRSERVTINCKYRNYSLVSQTVRCGLKLVDKATGAISYVWWIYAPSQLGSNYFFNPFEISGSAFPSEGTYTVTPAVLNSADNAIYDPLIPVDSPQSMTLVATPETLTFTPDIQQSVISATAPDLATRLYVGKRAVINTSVSNTGAEYFGKVELRFNRGATTVATVTSGMIDIEQGRSIDVTFDTTLPSAITAGSYTVGVYDNTGKLISPTVNVTVTAAPAGTPTITFSNIRFLNTFGGNGTSASPALVCADYFWIQATATCSGGYFDGDLRAYIFPETGGSSLTVLTDNTLPMSSGESRTVTFHGDLSDVVSVGSTYAAILSQPPTGGYISGDWNYFKVDMLTGIDDVTVDNSPLAVYPNPATDAVTIEAGAAVRAVSIYSLDGTLARRTGFDGIETTVTLDVDALAPGHYIITVETVSGITAERLIKR